MAYATLDNKNISWQKWDSCWTTTADAVVAVADVVIDGDAIVTGDSSGLEVGLSPSAPLAGIVVVRPPRAGTRSKD